MPATRSTTKHQRQTQNSQWNAVQQGRRDFSRCERCGGIFSLYRGSAKRHEDACKRREERRRLDDEHIQAVRWTPPPLPPSPFASSPESESESEAGVDIPDTVVDNSTCFPQRCYTPAMFELFTGNLLAPPTQGAEPHIQPRSTSPPPRSNPLILDPFLETTPPPGNPHDEFGIGTTPELGGSDTLQPGQTLVIYHPFAEHPPKVIDTAKLTLAREPDISPPSEEPYAPFSTRADFEQAEIFIRYNCTNSMIDDQLRLNQKTSQAGEPNVRTMKNAREMHKILAEAGEHWDVSSVCLPHHVWWFYNTYTRV